MRNSLRHSRNHYLGHRLHRGDILLITLVFGAIATYMLAGFTQWAVINDRASREVLHREQAETIAEAGIDYYRWHLANAPTDYWDGNASTTPGPYVHQFYDKDGNDIGTFSLTITPPLIGSTLTTITSTGTLAVSPAVSRTIQEQLAIPSLAQYAVVSNDNLRFGAGTVVSGPITANGGIHFDGLAENIVSSAQATYVDPDCTGTTAQCTEFGVYTDLSPADPQPPAAVPSRPDVFVAGRQFPVAAVDFTSITNSLSQLKSNAQSGGLYFAPSGKSGYYIQLKTNDTFNLYKVTALTTAPNGCTNSQTQTGWGTWTISTKTQVDGPNADNSYPFPADGLIFVEDNLWIDGQINTARLTIGAGTFPENPTTDKSITINNNLLYTNFNGQDSIGLIAQGNINAGLGSANTLTIDGALVAQDGRVGRYYYGSSCGTGYTLSTINLFGMIATDVRYGFAYTDGTGYTTRNINYDGNLLYSPPPSFPLTSSQYQIISWRQTQ